MDEIISVDAIKLEQVTKTSTIILDMVEAKRNESQHQANEAMAKKDFEAYDFHYAQYRAYCDMTKAVLASWQEQLNLEA